MIHSCHRRVCRALVVVLAGWAMALSASPAPGGTGGAESWPPGLVLHLSATAAGSFAGPKQANAVRDSISVWRDLSPARNDLSVLPGREGPSRIVGEGSHAVVQFSGSERLQSRRISGFQAGEQPFHAFIVLRARPDEIGASRLLDLSTTGNDPEAMTAYTQKRTGFWVGVQPFEAAAGRLRVGVHVGDEGGGLAASFDGGFHLVEITYPGRQRWAIHQDGRPLGRGKFGSDRTFLGFDGGAKLALGGLFGATNRADHFRGEVAEVLLFNRTLPAEEQRRVARTLATAHGLPTVHAETPPRIPRYEDDVQPVLQRHCAKCHGERKPEAGLRLLSHADLVRGGQGGPTLAPGDAARSLLFHVLEAGEMPPAEASTRLTDDEIETVRRWIDGGAPARESVGAPAALPARTRHWAFQRLRRPEIPGVARSARIRTDVDAFVAKRLETAGIGLSADAGRLTLLRRACLDLTGVLPTPGEVDAYLADMRSDAYERLLERLMASPQFGERWARHWLDGAGYTDTYPLDNDAGIMKPGPGKWEYRDYVVRAMNEDRPYNRFLHEQIAGDELVDWRGSAPWTTETRDRLVATGFLRCAADYTDENELNTLQVRFDVLQRTADTVAAHLLGLTAACAKCHDHKYEPIPQLDYYRFTAILAPALNPYHWLQPAARQLVALPPPEKASHDASLGQARAVLRALLEPAEVRLQEIKLSQLPAQVRDDVRAALAAPAPQRNEVQRYLADKFGAVAKHAADEILGVFSAAQRREFESATARIQEITNRWDAVGTIQAVYDVAPPSAMFVLRRGNYETPGAEVPPGLFSVITEPGQVLQCDPPTAGPTSGRRLALSRALTDWNSPAGALVARVRVNQIWQQLFGAGLVETPENLGVAGSPPSHPELLEWLAGEFVSRGTSLKSFLTLVMTSTVYRQSSRTDPTAAARDPGNRLLWRQRLRRVESEVVRDSLLHAAGRLDLTVGGPPVRIVNRPDGKVIEDPGATNAPPATARRSLYVLQRRNYNLSLLGVFDQPLMNLNCSRRNASAVVQQSLTMLNDEFVHVQASALADRVLSELPTAEPRDWLRGAFRRVLVRPPTEPELAGLEASLERQRAAFRSHGTAEKAATRQALAEVGRVLFNTSEFLYAD